MPAVANAIFDAVGVRIDEFPITPDKVLRALELKAEGKKPRVGPERFPPCPIRSRCSCRRRGKAATASEAPGKTSREGDGHAMMRLPWFEYRAPRSVAEAARILAGEGPARCSSPAAPTCCRT